MAKDILTLYIDDSNLRLLLARNRSVRQWAQLPLPPGLIKNNVVTDEAAVATSIQQVLQEQKIKSKRVMVCISGLRCHSRPLVFPPLPKEILDEAVRREASRVLPVPIGEFYISWQLAAPPSDKTQVFLLAVPRNTADALFRTLRRAGLRPYLLDVKPLALNRLAPAPRGIIVDVQNTEYDIVITADGVPQPIRTISLPSEELSLPQKLKTIQNDIERTIAFYNSNNPDKALADDAQVFASGWLTSDPELYQSLSREMGRPVVPLASPLEPQDGFQPGYYLANIGLTSRKAAYSEDKEASLININALPKAYQPRRVSLTGSLGIPGAAVAVALFISLLFMMQTAAADVTSLRSRLKNVEATLRERTTQRQALADEITALEKRTAEATASLASYTAAVGRLEIKTRVLNRDLRAVFDALWGTNVALKSITHDGTQLTVTGTAPNERHILDYLENLSAEGDFADIALTRLDSIQAEPSSHIDFILAGTHKEQGAGISRIEMAIGNLPGGIAILSVDYSKDSMSIHAMAKDQDTFLSYLRRMEESGLFADVVNTDLTRLDNGEYDFILLLKAGG